MILSLLEHKHTVTKKNSQIHEKNMAETINYLRQTI